MKRFFILGIITTLFLAGCSLNGTPSQPIITHPIQGEPNPTPPQACTEEAKLCPDGSAVGRTGPNCEFAKCPDGGPQACTMEAKICPDGSTVGRSGPNCEFTKCPGE